MIIKEKGKKTRYYYYKKKRGRHKKTGPKPKKVKKERRILRWNYKIVVTTHKKQIDYIDKYYCIEKALEAFNKLKEENEKIIFPKKFLNSVTMRGADYEYLLLEKCKSETKEVPKLRNEFGKMVDNIIVNNEKWVIYDKAPKLVEETFWVYGFHPRLQRKDFMWIFNNLIIDRIKSPYDILRIVLFKNKVIIKEDNNDINLITCKNMSDSIRMYNLLEEYCQNKKIKQVSFIGSANKVSDFRDTIVNDIMNKTGWKLHKITRSTTRP